MKKKLCLLTAVALLLSMTACAPKEQAKTDHIYKVTGTEGSSHKTITVKDRATGEKVQTLQIKGNDWFLGEPLYVDISFDGNQDIVVPYTHTAAGAYFIGYVWDSKEGQYLQAENFQSIANPALDAEEQVVLSRSTASRITTYSVYGFDSKKQDFSLERSLNWGPDESGKSMQVTERTYTAAGKEKETASFLVPASGATDVDKEDTRMAAYYKAGSKWDLDSNKWNESLLYKQEPTQPTQPIQPTQPTQPIQPIQPTRPEPSEPDKVESTGPVEFTPVTTPEAYFETKKYTPPGKVGDIQYLFHEPIRNTGKKYPLVIFLHGLGDTVNESTLGTAGPLVNTLMQLENQDEAFSTYTLVPSTPLAGEGWWVNWQLSFLKQLIYELPNSYNIDPKRIYVTGISMGGYTTCQLLSEMKPDTFAAAVPLSGAYDLINPVAVNNTAIRIYHSNLDTVVNVSCSRSLYQQLKTCYHPKAEYFEFSHGNHISPLYDVYYDRSFYDWLFAQKLP